MRGMALFRKLQSAEIEHVLQSADSRVLFAELSAVVRADRVYTEGTIPHSPHIDYMDSDIRTALC